MANQDVLLKTSLPGCRLVQCSSYSQRDLARSTVGLELGSSAVKAVAIRKGDGAKRRVVWWGIAELDPGLSDQRRREVIVGVLKRWRSLKGFPKRVALLAPSGHRLVAVVLPSMPIKELRQAALWEARSQLYFESDVVMNACPLPAADDGEKVTVIVAGIPEELRRQTYDVLRLSGLKVRRALPAAVALNSLSKECFPGGEVTRFLDLGFGAAKLVALVDQKPVFYREIPNVGENMVRAIAEQADLNPRLAERVLRRAQFVRDPDEKDPDLAYWGDVGTVQQMIFPEASALANEVEMSVHYLRAHFPGEVDVIYGLGGLTEIPGLLDYLGERVGVAFTMLPFPHETFDFGKRGVELTFKRNWTRLAAAAGAAVWGVAADRSRGMGIPLKQKRESPLAKVNVKLVASLALTVLVAFANLALMPKLRYLQSELAAQQAYLDELTERIDNARLSTQATDNPASRLAALCERVPGWDALLAALAQASSDRIWLQELGGTSQVLGLAEVIGGSEEGIVGGGDEENTLPDVATLQISGVAKSQDDAEEFASRLEATGLFSEVHLESLEHEEDDPNVVHFTMSLSVAPVNETRATQ